MKKTSTSKIFYFYWIAILLTVGSLYLLLPTILNYPPDSVDTTLQKDIDGFPYTAQFILISIVCICINLIILTINMTKIDKLIDKLKENNSNKQGILDKITKSCVQTPLILYATQIIIPIIFMPLVLGVFIGAETIVVLKISAIFILFLGLSATITYVFSR